MVGDREEVRRKGGVIGPRPTEEDAQGRTIAIALAPLVGALSLGQRALTRIFRPIDAQIADGRLANLPHQPRKSVNLLL